ncbi:hypothetical protein KCP71_04540 [Salmonella enterica subsp. enterica]|nr:hypothetical protein KCP71_04540 [Salmonella enterica subsp. enterica]
MGGKVLVPTQRALKLVAARLAADVMMGVPTLVIARTDADAADLISDCTSYDDGFITGERARRFLPTHAGVLSERSAAGCSGYALHMPIW